MNLKSDVLLINVTKWNTSYRDRPWSSATNLLAESLTFRGPSKKLKKGKNTCTYEQNPSLNRHFS